MYPLFETIAVIDGKPQNLCRHQQRYERSLTEFYGSAQSAVDLAKVLCKPTALSVQEGLVRCRLDYNQYHQRVQYVPYQKREIRTFWPVICDDINYSLKFSDRTLLNRLYEKRGGCDEIMIIRQGRVTDCSIGNLIFKRQGEWFTPDSFLLNGTQRQKLLSEGHIQEIEIMFKHIELFEEIRLINAMNGMPR